MKPKQTHVAFLRGINVGGHHKVPMTDLRDELESLGFENIITILNSGNILFDSKIKQSDEIENIISTHLEKHFGFPIPTIVRKSEMIEELFYSHPFEEVRVTKDIRLYISLLKNDINSDLEIPWKSKDQSYHILDKRGKDILSVLDLSTLKTPKAMESLEQNFGKEITTRNWKTIERIVKKLNS